MQFTGTENDIIISPFFYTDKFNKITNAHLTYLFLSVSTLAIDSPFLFQENSTPHTRNSLTSFLNLSLAGFSTFYTAMERIGMMNRFYHGAYHDSGKLYMINPFYIRKRTVNEFDFDSCFSVLNHSF